MTNNSIGSRPAGSEPSDIERFIGKWPDYLDAQLEKLLPEGKDCYGDRDRADFVEESYAKVAEKVQNCATGDPILLIGRRASVNPDLGGGRILKGSDQAPPLYVFRRTVALGELAGSGAGIFLDFRSGQLIFPTLRYASVQRDSLTGATKQQNRGSHEKILATNEVLDNQGLLPPKGDLMDRPLYTKLRPKEQGSRRRHGGLNAAQSMEMWQPIAELAIGEEEVEALMYRHERGSLKHMKKPYSRDFSLLRELLG